MTSQVGLKEYAALIAMLEEIEPGLRGLVLGAAVNHYGFMVSFHVPEPAPPNVSVTVNGRPVLVGMSQDSDPSAAGLDRNNNPTESK